MDANELLALIGNDKGDDLAPRDLIEETRTTNTPKEVRETLMEFAPDQGWLCLQSEVVDFLSNDDLPTEGVILYGEVAKTGGESLHIRQTASGGWHLTRYRDSDGDTYLAEVVDRLTERDAERLGNHRYRLYWGDVGRDEPELPASDNGAREIPGDGWVPMKAVFIGFGGKGEAK